MEELITSDLSQRHDGHGKGMTLHSFYLFRATPTAYGDSQARDQIEAVVTSLYHSHSNARSEPQVCELHHNLQQHRILNPLSKGRN